MRLASRFFRRQLELDEVAAQAPGLPCAHGDADGHPETADNPGFGAEIPPQNQANEETQEWREIIAQLLFLFTDEVANTRMPKKGFRARPATKVNAVSTLGKGSEAGHTN